LRVSRKEHLRVPANDGHWFYSLLF
jgi:hypothetical protein